MIAFVGILLAVLTFAFVVYPLVRQRPQPSPQESAQDTSLRELLSRRDTTYSMLKELEFDLQSGILSDEDYRELAARYRGKAISILKNMDNLAASSDVGDEIEQQVLALRQKKVPGEAAVGDETEEQVLTLRRHKGQFCPQCGTRHQEGDRFCAQCGARLKGEEG